MSKTSLDRRVVTIMNHIHAGVLYCKNDRYSTILYANDYFYQMIGYEKDEFAILFSNRFADLVVDDVAPILISVKEHIALGKDLDFEYRMHNKKGEIFWIHDTAKYDPENDSWYVTIMDITEMKSLKYERERLEFYLNNMPNKIVICNLDTTIIYKNRQAAQCSYFNSEATSLYQLERGHVLVKSLDEILCRASDGETQEYETRYRKNGVFIGHDKNRLIPIRNSEGKIMNYMQVSEDLLAKSDGLTRFPTRSMFEYYFYCFTGSRPDTPVHLMIIDVDEFKGINDTYGHRTGDEIIRMTARKLTFMLGPEDYICRFGGDEFLILFVDQALENIIKKARYVLNTALSPDSIGGTTIRITYSAGIASRGSGDDYESLLLKADRALYRTKANGKNNIHIFNGS